MPSTLIGTRHFQEEIHAHTKTSKRNQFAAAMARDHLLEHKGRMLPVSRRRFTRDAISQLRYLAVFVPLVTGVARKI